MQTKKTFLIISTIVLAAWLISFFLTIKEIAAQPNKFKLFFMIVMSFSYITLWSLQYDNYRQIKKRGNEENYND